MAGTVEQERIEAGWASRLGGWWLSGPLWAIVAVGLAASALLYGWTPAAHMVILERIAEDPFTVSTEIPVTDHYLYESPIGPLTTWAVGMPTAFGFGLVQLAALVVVLIGVAALIGRWYDAVTARLFLVAYFCSPQAAIGSHYFGMLDILIIGAATILTVGTTPAAFAAAAVLGVNHFSQGIIIFGVALIVRKLRGASLAPLVAGGVGLIVGRLITAWYQAGLELQTTRTEIVLDRGFEHYFVYWRGHLPEIIFSVFNVLWVAVFWALRNSDRRTRLTIGLTTAALLVPVLLTHDATRVYSNLTWPILMFVVLWFGENADRDRLREWVGYLLAAGVFVPRIVIWSHVILVSRWDR